MYADHAELNAELRAFWDEGRKIEAVKRPREEAGAARFPGIVAGYPWAIPWGAIFSG